MLQKKESIFPFYCSLFTTLVLKKYLSFFLQMSFIPIQFSNEATVQASGSGQRTIYLSSPPVRSNVVSESPLVMQVLPQVSPIQQGISILKTNATQGTIPTVISRRQQPKSHVARSLDQIFGIGDNKQIIYQVGGIENDTVSSINNMPTVGLQIGQDRSSKTISVQMPQTVLNTIGNIDLTELAQDNQVYKYVDQTGKVSLFTLPTESKSKKSSVTITPVQVKKAVSVSKANVCEQKAPTTPPQNDSASEVFSKGSRTPETTHDVEQQEEITAEAKSPATVSQQDVENDFNVTSVNAGQQRTDNSNAKQ